MCAVGPGANEKHLGRVKTNWRYSARSRWFCTGHGRNLWGNRLPWQLRHLKTGRSSGETVRNFAEVLYYLKVKRISGAILEYPATLIDSFVISINYFVERGIVLRSRDVTDSCHTMDPGLFFGPECERFADQSWRKTRERPEKDWAAARSTTQIDVKLWKPDGKWWEFCWFLCLLRAAP